MSKDSNENQSDTEYEDTKTGAQSPNLQTTNTDNQNFSFLKFAKLVFFLREIFENFVLFFFFV